MYPGLKLLDIPSNKIFAHFSLNCRPVPNEWTGSSQQFPGSNHAVLAVLAVICRISKVAIFLRRLGFRRKTKRKKKNHGHAWFLLFAANSIRPVSNFWPLFPTTFLTGFFLAARSCRGRTLAIRSFPIHTWSYIKHQKTKIV